VTPPLTVGLPVYNGARFLRPALESILGQTFADFRLVISDNGSTDETRDICRAYAEQDDRVTYVRHDVNRGAAWNYNAVFEVATTPYFKWAAADDLIAPTFVDCCLEALAAAPRTVALCYPRAVVIDAEGARIREQDDDLDVREPRPHRRLYRLLLNVVYGNPMFGVARRELLARTRLHGNYPSADWVLLAELALAGEIWELPDRLFLRREHAGTSRAANADLQELGQWFDPAAPPVKSEHRKLLVEFLAGIRHAELTSTDRALSYAAFAAAWTRRHSWLSRRAREALGRHRARRSR
jgi:glycosyltransferase involved in cell wall biosynthesis